MHEIDEINKVNRFQVIHTQVRGHSKVSSETFFYNRTTNICNSLSNNMVLAPTVSSLKEKLCEHQSLKLSVIVRLKTY